MKENTFEVMLENNRLRSWVRDTMEVRPMRAATDVGEISHGLHIACGNGSATELILKHFSVKRMSAVDRDPAVISAARAKPLVRIVDFSVQCVLSLDFADDTFDAAFDLADLHNYPEWRQGITELHRVLRPGGLLVLEEISRETFSHGAGRVFKALTDHPYDSMLTMAALVDSVTENGFEILHVGMKNPLGLFRYLVMVARKMSGAA